ncbi:MAG: redoxin family protein [Tepidisphaeraceae bacterium]
MKLRPGFLALMLAVSAVVVNGAYAASEPTTAPAAAVAAQPGDDLVAQIDALKPPVVDRAKAQDPEYVKAYIAERDAIGQKRAALIGELWMTAPTHPRAVKLVVERWRTLARQDEASAAQVNKEIDAALATASGPNLADFRLAQMQVAFAAKDDAGRAKAIDLAEAFTKDFPDDKRSPGILAEISDMLSAKDPQRSKALMQRLAEKYPTSPAAGMVKGKLKQLDGVGKPFELSFTDAISGKSISMADLKGKVVVIDFWATWCGPCVAEMPHNKELYAKYKDQGVEFIGISLDQPEEEGQGLTKLKKYVAENGITWPQYYMGKGWESEFSMAWGINAIPAMFVVDASGNLVSVSARGQLEKLIPELIAKRDGH